MYFYLLRNNIVFVNNGKCCPGYNCADAGRCEYAPPTVKNLP